MTDRASSTQWSIVELAEQVPARSDVAATGPTFADVFAGELAYVMRSLRRLGIQPRDVEDVAHDVFVIVHRELPRYDATRPLRPWLFGIAFRVASDFRRLARNQREVPSVAPPEVADDAEPPDRQLERSQDRALVLAALESVELGRRGVLVLHDIDGQPIPEVARALGIPLNTAYSRLRLARDELRAAVLRLAAKRGEP